MNRIVTAARLQLVAWPATLAWPWAILALSWTVNVAVYAALRYQHVDIGDGFTGGLISIYLMQFVVHVQVMTRGFSFAVGLSMSRRSYYLGVTLFAVAQAVVYGIAISLLRLLEDATGGWGLDLRYFGVSLVRQSNPGLQLLVYTVPFLLVAALGMTVGAVFRRWGGNGVLTLSAALMGIGGVSAVLVTLREWWSPIGHWFIDQSPAGLFAGWPALVALLVGGLGYLTARRTTIA